MRRLARLPCTETTAERRDSLHICRGSQRHTEHLPPPPSSPSRRRARTANRETARSRREWATPPDGTTAARTASWHRECPGCTARPDYLPTARPVAATSGGAPAIRTMPRRQAAERRGQVPEDCPVSC